MFDMFLFFTDPALTPRKHCDTRRIDDNEFLQAKFCNADGDGGDGDSDGGGSSGPLSGGAWSSGSSPSDNAPPSNYDSSYYSGEIQMCGPPVQDRWGNPVFDGYGNYVTTEPWNAGAYTGGGSSRSQTYVRYVPFGPNSGVYSGSLSSLGNMVAMCVAQGSGNYRVVYAGQTNNGFYNVGDYITGDVLANTSGSIAVQLAPFSTGYFREYWSDPTKTTFGANTPMPALTGVMPAGFTDMPGNFIYYVDLQLQRLSGSNTWNDRYFMSAFNQAVSWVVTSNNYLASLTAAQNTNFAYYGATDYSSLTTQGFGIYKQGQALRQALRNLGLTVSTVPDGHFGTPNAVAKSIIDNGVGDVNNFASKIYRQGVIYSDIYNPNYTAVISAELAAITNIADLAVIQTVLESSIPNIASALDYTSINKASGLSNDSAFESLAAFGKDLYARAPNLQVSNGVGLAALIDLVQNEVTPNVANIAGNDATSTSSLLSQDIIDSLKTYLPIGVNGGPVSVMNVIGSAAGYLTEGMKAVNDGIERLYATDYGIRLRDTLTDISRYYSGYPLTEDEKKLTRANWDTMLEEKKTEYYNLVNEIVADTTENIRTIVTQINENYGWCCQNLYWEYQNWNKAKLTISEFSDTSQYFSFVSTMPGYGIDLQNIGTDYLLYGLCQPNQAGDVAKTILAQAKTNFLLANAGVQITGIL